MKTGWLIPVLFFLGCAKFPPLRDPAALLGDISHRPVSHELSAIKPTVASELQYYLRLKDDEDQDTDINSSAIELKDRANQIIPFKLEREKVGHYYLALENTPQPWQFPLRLFYQQQAFKDQLNCYTLKADARQSKIQILEKAPHELSLELLLKDSKGNIIQMNELPEIILEGAGEVQELRAMSPGRWQFKILYPDDNEIMYFSVRTNNAYLERIFRLQFIAK